MFIQYKLLSIFDKNKIRINKKQFQCVICERGFKSGSRYFGGNRRWNDKQCISCFLNTFDNHIEEIKSLFSGIIYDLKVEKKKAMKNRELDMMMELGR